MIDTFYNNLNIGDIVIFMVQYYDGRWESFHKGKVIGFTNCFVKIKPNEEDTNWDFFQYVKIDQEWVKMRKPYIIRQPHKLIKI